MLKYAILCPFPPRRTATLSQHCRDTLARKVPIMRPFWAKIAFFQGTISCTSLLLNAPSARRTTSHERQNGPHPDSQDQSNAKKGKGKGKSKNVGPIQNGCKTESRYARVCASKVASNRMAPCSTPLRPAGCHSRVSRSRTTWPCTFRTFRTNQSITFYTTVV